MAYRIKRLNQLIRKEISDLLQRQVKDPRLGSFISVNEVATSSDLRHAKVFVSHLSSLQQKRETLEALAAASGFLRGELSKRLSLRNVPELDFYWDDSIERGAHILELIDRVAKDEDRD